MDIVAKFREPLEGLERERQRVERNRKGFAFLVGLASFLALLCFFTALATSSWLYALSTILGAGAVMAWRLRAAVDDDYQVLFRERVTRTWFHEVFPGAYLAAPSGEISDTEYFLVAEASRTVSRFHLRGTRIEDRVYFERETEGSHILILANGRRRVLLFARRREGTVLPPSSELLSALRRFARPRIRSTQDGLWIAVPLKRRLFAAPVATSALANDSYQRWSSDAKILLDEEIRRLWLATR